MDIQSLLLSGYSLSDIKELLALFKVNLNEAKKVITRNNEKQTKLTIHKIKGGLIMLEFKYLLDSCCSIEDKIRVYGVKPYPRLINSFLNDSMPEVNFKGRFKFGNNTLKP